MRRWWTKVGLAGAATLVAAGLALAGANAWVLTHGGPAYETATEVPNHSVAIVPGARVHAGGTPYPALADRLEAALALYEAKRVDRILVSGDHHQQGYDEVNGMQRWLLDRGVAADDVFLDHAGLRTLDTMERAARVFQVRDAVICTQRYHLGRSLFLAHAAGIDAVGLVADRRVYPQAQRDAVREALARGRAFADVYVLGTEPRFLGEPIPISGRAEASYDRKTQRRGR